MACNTNSFLSTEATSDSSRRFDTTLLTNNHLPRAIRSLHFTGAVIRHLVITVQERAANTEQASTEEATHLLKLSSSHMITL